MKIRLATPDDVLPIFELVKECTAELEDGHGTPRQHDAMLMMIGVGIDNGEAVYVAEDSAGNLGGYVAWCHLPGNAEGWVEGVGTYVRPQYRRGGLSKKLRTHATMHCREKGYLGVRGVAAKTNEAAVASVLKEGFQVVGLMVERRF